MKHVGAWVHVHGLCYVSMHQQSVLFSSPQQASMCHCSVCQVRRLIRQLRQLQQPPHIMAVRNRLLLLVPLLSLPLLLLLLLLGLLLLQLQLRLLLLLALLLFIGLQLLLLLRILLFLLFCMLHHQLLGSLNLSAPSPISGSS